MFTAILVRDTKEDRNYIFQIGDLVQKIDYTDGRKLKEQKGNCEVIQRLIITRKEFLSSIQGCGTKGEDTLQKPRCHQECRRLVLGPPRCCVAGTQGAEGP